MNYGLYLSASGVLTNMYRQDVFANNLANAQTPGFKRDLAAIMHRAPEALEDRHGLDVEHELLDRLGGGALAAPQRISFDRGSLRQSSNPLDVALEHPETFFAVQNGDPGTGDLGISLTRNGRFALGSNGTLVTVDEGRPVLDPRDRPIRLEGGTPVHIDTQGRIHQNGSVVARLQVTAVNDPARLVKQGGTLLGWEGPQDLRTPPETFTARQGFVEDSNVDPIKALMDVVSATKAATGNGNLIRYHDLLMDRAVNTLGRVTA